IDTKSISDWHKEKHTLTVKEVDGQPAFVLRSGVDSKGAKGTARVLADVTASKRAAQLDDDVASGKWTAEMSVTPAEMEKFSELVLSAEGGKKAWVLGNAGRGDFDTLVAES